jgi:hypothetical protein
MNYSLGIPSHKRRGAQYWRDFRCAEEAVIVNFYLHITIKMEQLVMGDH